MDQRPKGLLQPDRRSDRRPRRRDDVRGGAGRGARLHRALRLVDCSTIAGWGWDANLPNTPINVDVYVDAVKVSTLLADIFRADLQRDGAGDGRHAFSFPTPSQTFTGKQE